MARHGCGGSGLRSVRSVSTAACIGGGEGGPGGLGGGGNALPFPRPPGETRLARDCSSLRLIRRADVRRTASVLEMCTGLGCAGSLGTHAAFRACGLSSTSTAACIGGGKGVQGAWGEGMQYPPPAPWRNQPGARMLIPSADPSRGSPKHCVSLRDVHRLGWAGSLGAHAVVRACGLSSTSTAACEGGGKGIQGAWGEGMHSPPPGPLGSRKLVDYLSSLPLPRAAWAAASRAIGTRNGEHDT